MNTIIKEASAEHTGPQLLWLDLTRKCQLKCVHCYNESGPEGTHGTMGLQDWISVLNQAASYGIRRVQAIGGEPTLHPEAAELVDHALGLGLEVEIFSNLVHVSEQWWDLFRRAGIALATSYYSDRADEHNAITGRSSHRLTRANIEKAVRLSIPLRVGIIATSGEQRVRQARRELEEIGVTSIRVDRVRHFGRGAQRQAPDMAQLCGRCGTGKASVSPTGEVSPCVFSTWMSVGNVHDAALATILSGTAMTQANESIQAVTRTGGCDPDDECSPGHPGSGCNPRT
ncbi:MAG TPA: radical SAM/SPASM domain-containing protein [Streptosporangiaceae bacterium]